MNSGAIDSVAPPTTCPHIPLGQEYRTAGGERLKNEGQRHMQAWTDEGSTVGMTYQVAEVTKPVNSGLKLCDAENVVTFTAEGGTMKNLWTGASMHFGGESGVYVLNTLKKRNARRNGFCQPDNVISSRAVSPMLKQVSDEGEVQEIEESTSDDEEQDPSVSHGIDDQSETEREARQLRRQRHAHRPPTVEEIQEHLRTHLPNRSWCQHCVSGRGVSTQHRRRRLLFPPQHDRRGINTRVGHERPRNLSSFSSCCSCEGSCCRMDCTASCS